MAREEVVTYTCDVCGKQEDGTKVQMQPFPAPPSMIRPPGWGSVHLQGQDPEMPSERYRAKADFCSEECLDVVVSDFKDQLWGAQTNEV